MDKYFRTEAGKNLDVLQYIADQVSKNPNVQIHIGCDSQVFGAKIKFVICVVFRVGIRGGHVVYKKIVKERPPKDVPQDTQIYNRLLEEVYMTMELAQFLLDNTSIKIHAVEFDFNEEDCHFSNKLLNLATGWAMGLGFSTKSKPDELLACKAADHYCRT
ncbi:hypothetical protein [Leptolyngbya phage Lbo-JY46]